MPPLMIVAFLRAMLKRSEVQATIGSKLPMQEVKAAAIKSRKKIEPKIWPPGKSPKAIGSTWNTSPAPAPGSKPCANTKGKMAKPASKATKVSANTTMNAFCVMDVSLPRYEP